MQVLLTGTQGFLGGRTLEMLLERGYRVRALVRRAAPELAARGMEAYQADLGDMAAVRTAVRGCEAVIHCAAKSGVWGPLDAFIQANFLNTANLLIAAREAGVKYFIHTSSPSVAHTGEPLDGVDESAPLSHNPAHAYPYSKMLAERLIVSANQPDFRTVALRPHLIWGPGDPHFLPRLVERAKQNRLWLLKSEALVDGVYIDNAAHAHILALETLRTGADIGGKPYFIAQGEPMTAYALISKILHAASNGQLRVRGQLPALVGKAGAALLETAWKAFSLKGEPPITRFVAEELTLPHWFTLNAAKRDLGYAPTISMTEGLERLAAASRGTFHHA